MGSIFPVWVTSALIITIWGTSLLAFFVIGPYWLRSFMTEARRRQIREEGIVLRITDVWPEVPRRKPPLEAIWSFLARLVVLALPLVLVIDGLFLRKGILDAPALTVSFPGTFYVQVIGSGMALTGALVLVLAARALIENVAARAPEEQRLINRGIYSRVRHPFYLHVFLITSGTVLLTLNYLALLQLFFYVWSEGPENVVKMIRAEEQKLIDKFGDDYRHYMKGTGRFLPKLRRTSS